jgi:transposase-like protein
LSLFKRRRFPVEIILLCVRWYCKYGISYRELAEMMQERGVEVDPFTIFRWVQRYAPEIEKRVRHYQGFRSGLWRVDETTCGLAGAGSICSERWTSMDSGSTSCWWIAATPEPLIASCAKPSR